MTADEAFRTSVSKENITRDNHLKKVIKTLQERIKSDLSYDSPQCCILCSYTQLRDKAVLGDVERYFTSKGYDVTLLNNERYDKTNILIISYQNRSLFLGGEQELSIESRGVING